LALHNEAPDQDLGVLSSKWVIIFIRYCLLRNLPYAEFLGGSIQIHKLPVIARRCYPTSDFGERQQVAALELDDPAGRDAIMPSTLHAFCNSKFLIFDA
jgi:hypothetical protein